MSKQTEALDKKAENARELGLDYEPAPATELREQQEPVAWVVEDQYGERLEWAEVAHIGWGWKKLPLYTSPQPSKPWVGLTDEEIRRTDHHMVDGAYHYSFKQGAQWAEAKLREKNA